MENKDTWTWQSPRFQVFQALHSKESCLAAQAQSTEVIQEGLLTLAFWEGGGWNLEAEEHLALLP